MRIRLLSIVLVIILAFVGSSCVNLLNEVKINADKSGSAFIGVEINALSGMINTDSDKLSKENKNSLLGFNAEAEKRLKGVKGISNIRATGALSFGRLGIKFDFENAKALNRAYYSLMDMEYKWYSPKIISIRNHSVKVRNVSSYIKDQVKESDSEFFTSSVMEYLNIATVIEVPNKITSVKMDVGEISYNGKTISIITPLKSVVETDATVGFKFKY
ncbi:MAG: hypothetical protein KAG84_03060 [Bacteroidales bacterium]|nr:hypothetical protein [Bacteroidales bacterium]